MAEKIEVEGQITDIVFHSKENGYTVAVFETETDQLTVVGSILGATAGRTYLLRGEFTNHAKYGEQFKIATYEEVIPTSIDGIEGFLSSGVLKGIGPKMAAAIVSRFGEDTFAIIENTPEKLVEVSGIGEAKAKIISDAFTKHREFAEVTLFLQQFGITSDFALKLYKVYGESTIAAIEENPYRMVDDIFGIGFKKADKIAAKLGFDRDDPFRIESGINFMLWHFANEGNSFMPEKKLAEQTAMMLEVSSEDVLDAITTMAFNGRVQIENLQGRRVVFLMIFYLAEQYVTKKLVSLVQGDLKPIAFEIDALIAQTESHLAIEFSNEQKNAIKNCLNNGVSVITGGPGTGKTTIINGILNILKWAELKIAIAAPTGRAAKRITETTGEAAMTIHRLLEYYYSEEEGQMRFGKTEEEPLKYDAIIIDEASMVDLLLMEGLLKAITPGTRLILVGDADQLPSVSVGNVLRDIIDSEYIYSERLTEIFRQAEKSLIVVNAHRINRGDYPICNEADNDFFFMSKKTEVDALKLILELANDRLPKYYKLNDRVQDLQVLTPTKKGRLGSANLNAELQGVLNPPRKNLTEKQYGGKIFREQDKVMQIKNNYQLEWVKSTTMEQGEGVFNGDIGFIHKIDNENKVVTVIFDGDKFVDYEFMQLEELELAYAMTVHKSQGSEFPVVVMPMSWVPPVLATRNLLYTGVTRGKKAVVLVGSERQMQAMVDNNSIKKRNSGLAIRIKNFL